MPDFKPDIQPPARLHRGRASVFAYSLWTHGADGFGQTVEVPTHQWMGAIGRRTLTPAEQNARREYFDRKIAECTSRRRG